jgi:hypothetical protein
MAIPPIVGVGWLCQRSARGGTIAPNAGATRRTAAHSASEASSEMKKEVRR